MAVDGEVRVFLGALKKRVESLAAGAEQAGAVGEGGAGAHRRGVVVALNADLRAVAGVHDKTRQVCFKLGGWHFYAEREWTDVFTQSPTI